MLTPIAILGYHRRGWNATREGEMVRERIGNATASSHADESTLGGCGLVLVREISHGRCTATHLPNENVPGDTERICGLDDGGNVTHSCDCRWSLPLMVPLHPPKFAYGCNLFLSMARTDVTHEHRGYWSGQKSRLRFVPVFSSNEDLDVFAFRYGQAAVTHAMVVPVAHGEIVAPAAKKLRALRRLFHGPEPPSHAIALDAESAVNLFEGYPWFADAPFFSLHLELASARDQELAHELRDYRFTWARQPAPNRLLRFHLDRDHEMPSLLCGAGGELDSSQLFSTYLAAARAASHAQAAQGQAAPKLQEELNATREAARRIERELRTQIAALEAKLADAARRAEEHEQSTR
eukprot:jgi/Chrpa1/7389/Chrysochromulina_OHIO_Genome00002822-RA